MTKPKPIKSLDGKVTMYELDGWVIRRFGGTRHRWMAGKICADQPNHIRRLADGSVDPASAWLDPGSEKIYPKLADACSGVIKANAFERRREDMGFDRKLRHLLDLGDAYRDAAFVHNFKPKKNPGPALLKEILDARDRMDAAKREFDTALDAFADRVREYAC